MSEGVRDSVFGLHYTKNPFISFTAFNSALLVDVLTCHRGLCRRCSLSGSRAAGPSLKTMPLHLQGTFTNHSLCRHRAHDFHCPRSQRLKHPIGRSSAFLLPSFSFCACLSPHLHWRPEEAARWAEAAGASVPPRRLAGARNQLRRHRRQFAAPFLPARAPACARERCKREAYAQQR